MSKEKTREDEIKSLWLREGVWKFSNLIRKFRKIALKKYPTVEWTPKAKEPQDTDTISQNLIYLFPGHILKISKSLSTAMSDDESIDFLSRTNEYKILDLACGIGTAGIGVIDFLVRLISNKIVKRENPLKVSVILNDIQPNCTKAAKSNLTILRKLIQRFTSHLRLGDIEICNASISEVLNYLSGKSKIEKFNLMVMAHPFDPILYHAEKALEVNPECTDPIVHARPCDRPGILGDFYMRLGEFADPYYSRSLLVQENRYSPLLPICLPTGNLKVIRTYMEQEALRPDCPTETMKVPFAYCAYKYSYSTEGFSRYPITQPLPHMEDMKNCFEEGVDVEFSKNPIFFAPFGGLKKVSGKIS